MVKFVSDLKQLVAEHKLLLPTEFWRIGFLVAVYQQCLARHELFVFELQFLLFQWPHGLPLSLIDPTIQSRGISKETLAHDKISYLTY